MGFTHTGFIAPFCTQQTALQLDPLPIVGDSNTPNSLQLVTLPPWVDHEAAIATSVVCPIAVDEFLLRELDRFVGFDLVQAFHRRHRQERPATPTIPLIFNRSNSTFAPPINRLRQLLVTSDDISPAQPDLGLTWTGLMSWLRDIHHSSIHTNRHMGEWCSGETMQNNNKIYQSSLRHPHLIISSYLFNLSTSTRLQFKDAIITHFSYNGWHHHVLV